MATVCIKELAYTTEASRVISGYLGIQSFSNFSPDSRPIWQLWVQFGLWVSG